jgi:hypothetical protein
MRWRRDLRRRIDRQHGLAFLSDDAVLKAFKANVPAVRAEQGCIAYTAFVACRDSVRWRRMATIRLSSSKSGNRRPL